LEGDVARRPGADIMTARVQERETEAAVSRVVSVATRSYRLT
jgi:hypothetical protein